MHDPLTVTEKRGQIQRMMGCHERKGIHEALLESTRRSGHLEYFNSAGIVSHDTVGKRAADINANIEAQALNYRYWRGVEQSLRRRARSRDRSQTFGA